MRKPWKPVETATMAEHMVGRRRRNSYRPMKALLQQLRYRVASGEDAADVLDALQITHPPHRRAYLNAL